MRLDNYFEPQETAYWLGIHPETVKQLSNLRVGAVDST